MKTLFFSLVLLLAGTAALAQDKGLQSAEFVSQPKAGVIQLHATGYGKNAKVCIEEAQKNAFKVLLFRGLPGSPANTPLIPGDVTGSRMDPRTAAFFDQAVYKKFIPRITQFSALKRTKMGKRVVVDMDVDYQALRAYFEETGVIRKFGY